MHGRMDAEFNHKNVEVRKSADVLKSVWKNRNVSMETKRGMYEGIVVPTALYGSEAWVLDNKVKNRMDVAEMSCLRSMYQVLLLFQKNMYFIDDGPYFKCLETLIDHYSRFRDGLPFELTTPVAPNSPLAEYHFTDIYLHVRSTLL